MSLWPDLRARATSAELMDDHAHGGRELLEALGELRVINLLLRAYAPTIAGVDWLWRRGGRPRRLCLVDVGAGSGDAIDALARWAARRGVAIDITMLDLNQETVDMARLRLGNTHGVRAEVGDLFDLPPGSTDIVTANMVLHHLPDARLVPAVEALARSARLGVVVNDLHRSALAWLGIRMATQLVSRNRMIRHDAPLSVARGFRFGDIARWRERPILSNLRVTWHPLFRWLVTLDTRAP